MNRGKKKILLVYDVSYPSIEGGGQRRLWEVGRRLSAQGYDVDWVCFKTWVGESSDNDQGINYIGLAGFKGLYKRNGKRRVLETLEFAKALIFSKLDFENYDYIWSGQWPILHLLWWFIRPSSLGSTKLIVDWWEIWERTWFSYSKTFGFVGYLLEKLLIKRLSQFAHLVLVSPDALKKAQRMSPEGHFSLIHNGVDVREIASINPAEERSDVIYLGRLKDHKRVDLLVQAVAHVKKHKGVSLRLIVIGDGPEEKMLQKMTQDLGINDQVVFKGSINSNKEVYSLLKSSKLFVNPSTKEGGGSITLFEGYACGLPSIVFECKDGIDPSLVEDMNVGELVRSISSEELASTILELTENQKKYAALKENVYSFAEQFDWNGIAGRYIALFEEKSKESRSCE